MRFPEFTVQLPMAELLKRVGLGSLLVGLGLFMGTVAVLQVICPGWLPPQRAAVGMLVGLVAAVLEAIRKLTFQWTRATVSPDSIEFNRLVGTVKFEVRAVAAVLGMPGIDLSGGPLLVWKYLVLLTDTGKIRLRFGPQDHPILYGFIRSACPGAWGLPYAASLEPPDRAAARTNPLAAAHKLTRLQSAFRSELVRSVIVGMGLIVLPPVVLVALILGGAIGPAPGGGVGPVPGKALFFLVVLFVVGFLVMADVLRKLSVYRTILRARRAFDEAL